MISPKIERVGLAFRKAFEEVYLSDAPGFLPHFPEGCCNWATWMVGQFLKLECELEPIEIQGTRLGESETDNHAWVLVDGIIVDLTCGQYPDCEQPIIISEKSVWHSQWSVDKIQEIRPIQFYDPPFRGTVLPSEIYERLALHVHTQLA